jgi:hypothetical protein
VEIGDRHAGVAALAEAFAPGATRRKARPPVVQDEAIAGDGGPQIGRGGQLEVEFHFVADGRLLSRAGGAPLKSVGAGSI